jgi:hypothetical protein
MRTRWLPCDGRVCSGHRLHEITTTVHPGGRVTREATCTVCCETEPYGICCPKCGDVRFQIITTRHRTGGATFRVKRCRHCRHRIRTRETVESVAG